MKDELVNAFEDNQSFTKNSAVLRLRYYNLETIIIQYVPVMEKIGKEEVNRMRTGK